jgi:hypothetical protein
LQQSRGSRDFFHEQTLALMIFQGKFGDGRGFRSRLIGRGNPPQSFQSLEPAA